jgi:hypothetical protein
MLRKPENLCCYNDDAKQWKAEILKAIPAQHQQRDHHDLA